MLTQDEFEEIIHDPSKRVDGDLQWTVDNNVLWAKFRAEVEIIHNGTMQAPPDQQLDLFL